MSSGGSAPGWDGPGILLDIEGTTSSIGFVYDVLFPYARRELVPFLEARWDDPEVARARDLIAHDAGAEDFQSWSAGASPEPARARLVAEVQRLMDADVKATGLKALQGLIWREGYRAGELRSHVYADVPPALRAWSAAGRDVRIYSSGSAEAQRQFFGHTEAGDLRPFLRGHYDTTLGPKRAAQSYAAIAADMGLRPAEVVFLSDVAEELDAARAAGMEALLVVRPGNAPAREGHGYRVIHDFAQV